MDDAILVLIRSDYLVGSVGFHGLHDVMKGMRQEIVVAVAKHDVWCARSFHPSPAGCRHAAVLTVQYPQPGMLAGHVVADCSRSVGRSVIDGYHLIVIIGLRQCLRETMSDVCLFVIDRNDDANFHERIVIVL
jgi:hypothetical protein